MRISWGLAKLTEVAAPQVSARNSYIGRAATQITPGGKALISGFPTCLCANVWPNRKSQNYAQSLELRIQQPFLEWSAALLRGQDKEFLKKALQFFNCNEP
ncbi:MAG TPA: hypothetical protein DCM70_09360 [Rhodobacteraceae bacterium]|jgi:hypothetical protein|nr:hypothetical protein [Paracoccaceae bacterium]|tara:strand:+ start:203 stop:505 length:303 start_codon:yes stop_codon:yes gene_type:complete